MGTYNIVEVIAHPAKFAAKVSFNGEPVCYYEVELEPVEGDEVVADETPSARVNRFLQREADAHAERLADAVEVSEELASIKVVSGKIDVE